MSLPCLQFEPLPTLARGRRLPLLAIESRYDGEAPAVRAGKPSGGRNMAFCVGQGANTQAWNDARCTSVLCSPSIPAARLLGMSFAFTPSCKESGNTAHTNTPTSLSVRVKGNLQDGWTSRIAAVPQNL